MGPRFVFFANMAKCTCQNQNIGILLFSWIFSKNAILYKPYIKFTLHHCFISGTWGPGAPTGAPPQQWRCWGQPGHQCLGGRHTEDSGWTPGQTAGPHSGDNTESGIWVSKDPFINSLAPGKFEWNFRYVLFKLIFVIDGWGISCEIVLTWMPQNLTDDESTLVQVMARCRQATSHYLSQCCHRSMSP